MIKDTIQSHDDNDMNQPPREFSDLNFIEQLTLWSLRHWAACHKEEQSPYETLNQAYRLAKVKDAMPAFDGFMSVLVVGLYRQMDVRCMKCGGISRDEKIVLSALAQEQRGNQDSSRSLMGRLLSPSALRIGQNMLSAWASALAKGGQVLPLRDWGPMEDEYEEFYEEPAYYSPAILH